jgi:hypothetical protein
MAREWSGSWGAEPLFPLGRRRFRRCRGPMGPRLVWQDLRRTVQGAITFTRYLRSQETIDIALGLFEAASSTSIVSRPSRYVIRIANVDASLWNVIVILEISPHTPALPAAKPSVWFAKHCAMLPSRATEIEFYYDWRSTVTFMIDHVASPPDRFSMGEIKTGQRYCVSAILSDGTGKHLDQLDIYQELRG